MKQEILTAMLEARHFSGVRFTWEQEWDDDTRYFVILPNGDALGYDFTTECFYLNNYWNEISYDEAMQMLKVLA